MEKAKTYYFLEDYDEKILPKSVACFNILYVSIVHSDQIPFNKYFNQGLKYGASGFSRP